MDNIAEMYARFGINEEQGQKLKSFSHADQLSGGDTPPQITIETIIIENGQARTVSVEVGNA